VEQANAAGGYRGLPFRLIEYEDLPRWGASSNTIVRMAYEDHVWAALGSVSGDSSHIAIRVALKALLPVMNSATGDPTLTETAIPWAFRCIADSRQESYALARTIFVEHGLRRIAVIRANSRYGRMGIVELRDAAKRLGHPLVTEVNWIPGAEDLSPLVERVASTRPDGLVVWGGAEMAGRALAQARALGLDVPAFGPSRVIDERFLKEAGAAAEGFTAVATFDPTSSDPAWLAFREVYRQRWDEEPDAYAAHAFDGMNLVLDAVREAGLNRVRIRAALAAVERYQGVTGPIVFDNTFNDVGPVYLARVEEGAFRYRPEPANGWRPGEPLVAGRSEAPVTLGLLLSGDGAETGSAAERGARLALAERGAATLVTSRITGPWSTASQAARDLMVRDGATGLLTLLDHAGSHAAAQVATRLRRPLITVNDPSTLLHYTGVPWVAGPDGATAPPGFERSYAERYGAPPCATARAAYLAARRLLQTLDRGTDRALAPTPSLLPPAPSSPERAERPVAGGPAGRFR
jgi:ABC-type branched-subunit amino acid transport system substrate-binding protein